MCANAGTNSWEFESNETLLAYSNRSHLSGEHTQAVEVVGGGQTRVEERFVEKDVLTRGCVPVACLAGALEVDAQAADHVGVVC